MYSQKPLGRDQRFIFVFIVICRCICFILVTNGEPEGACHGAVSIRDVHHDSNSDEIYVQNTVQSGAGLLKQGHFLLHLL